ncbi:MAG: hypothetical protein U0790_08505 [Isosphaeraceae bacterium]
MTRSDSSWLRQAQGHLADQLALDRVAGPEVAGEAGLAALHFLLGLRRQDDPRR